MTINPYPFCDSDSVRLSPDGSSVVIIDQTELPNRLSTLSLNKPEGCFEAISALRVRGAPAIGIFAGFAMYVLARKSSGELSCGFLRETAEYLRASRPTAVNLSHALDRMLAAADEVGCADRSVLLRRLEREAYSIRSEDIEMCRAISEYGLSLVGNGYGILTHCNAGPLATSRLGTGLGTLFLGKERGYDFHVYCDETRPLLQGARLTAYELYSAGIDVTLICDNMAGAVMKQGKINACFVGCDRVAANGDTANKIGTSSVAVLAKHYGIPFYVFCPSSTIDLECACGDDIVIEERPEDEIKSKFFTEPIALRSVKCYNPAFDVTDGELIEAIITEKGIFRPPFDFRKEFK